MTNVTPAFRRLAFSGSLAALALLLVGTTAALAQARIEDCEKIQAADAYNQCLAKFGPTSKVKELAPERPGDIKGSGDEAAAGAEVKAPAAAKGGRHAARGRVARGRHGARHYVTRGSSRRTAAKPGRKRMTIIVKRRH